MGRDRTELSTPATVSPGTAIAVGLIAGLAMTLLMVALRFALDTVVLPELMADWLIKLTPPPVFDYLLERLQVSAKPLFFAALLAGQVLSGGLLGLAYSRYSHGLPFEENQRWRRGLLLGLLIWIVVVALVTPLVGGGFLGSSVPGGSPGYLLATLLSVVAYTVTLSHLHFMVLPGKPRHAPGGRREFLRRAAFLGVLLAGGGFAARTIVQSLGSITPSRVFHDSGKLPPAVTPNEKFYEVSKNIVNPSVDAELWRLEVGGDVGNPFTLTYDELRALPSREQYVTLRCISDPVGGGLISNALWKGVPLKLLLERARIKPGTKRLAFHAFDGYVDSFPLEIAQRDNVLVAYEMNGEPLPDSHGFPARIVVPGLWGMENVKWLTKIEPVSADFRGYWQIRGWEDSGEQNTMSRIDVPSERATVPTEERMVGGIAFAGDRGVKKVEISTDGGYDWQEATLEEPLSPYTWVLWTATWLPPAPQTYTIAVRATGGTGEPQTAEVRGSLPSGATGYHKIVVTVSEPAQEKAS